MAYGILQPLFLYLGSEINNFNVACIHVHCYLWNEKVVCYAVIGILSSYIVCTSRLIILKIILYNVHVGSIFELHVHVQGTAITFTLHNRNM